MPRSRSNKFSSISNVSRRRLLYGGAAGMAGLAGCIGDDEDPSDIELGEVDDSPDIELPDDEDADDLVDQAFVVPTLDNPEEGSIIMRGPSMPEEFETRFGFAGHVYRTMYEPVIYGRVFERAYTPAPGEIHYGILEDIEHEADRVRFTIRDDAYWSDGEPVRALDGPGRQILQRLASAPVAGQWLYDDPDHYNGTYNWYVDVEFPDGPDGKVWELVAPPDMPNLHEERMQDPEAQGWFYLRVVETSGALNWPTHIEPYDGLIDDLLAEVERGNEGDQVRDRAEMTVEHIDESTYERFRDPENVLSYGPWTLSEIRGAEEWVLEPNEYHRLADEINFPEVRMPWVEEDVRLAAELRAGRLDYAQMLADPELVNQLEDTGYTQQLSPVAEDGAAVCFRHNHPVFGNVKVRQAVGFAIDQYEIAETVHPDITVPVEVPSGDHFGREAFVSDEWVDENLQSFDQDLDRAEELMQDAGMERDGDDKWLHEGERIQELYPTTADAPIQERIVVDQLNEFGFDLELISVEDDIFTERFFNQEYGIFPEGPHWGVFQTGHIMRAIFARWINIMTFGPRIEGWMMYEPEEINYEISELLDDYSWQVILDDHLDPYIEIPPIGEWDAEPERFYLPDRINEVFYHGDATHPDYLDMIKQLMWTTNWFVPTYQIYYLMDQHWTNQNNWNWPTDHASWDYFGEALDASDYLSLGMITADPDNPK